MCISSSGVRGEKSFAEATEEYFNDMISGAFFTEKGANDFIAWLNKEDITDDQKHSVLETIVNIFKSLADWIKGALDSMTTAQRHTANLALETQEEIRNLYFDAMEQAIDIYKGNSTSEATEDIPQAASAVAYSAEIMRKKEIKIPPQRKNIKKAYDILDELKNNKKRNGIVKPDDDSYNNKNHQDEINAANIIAEELGIDIMLRKEVNIKNKSNPDYLASDESGKLGELKSPKSEKAAYDLAHVGIHQIGENPWFLAFDFDGFDIDIKKAWDNIEHRIDQSAWFNLDVYVISKGKIVGARRYEMEEAVPHPTNGWGSASKKSITQSAENASEKYKKNKNFSLAVDEMSTKQLDDAYTAAVESSDEERQAELVREAANRAGYDSPILYHGTRDFGFTEFDLDKMDDKTSIFTTDSKELASSYSGSLAVRGVNFDKNDAKDLYKNGTRDEKLKFLQEKLGDDYRYARKDEVKDYLYPERKQIRELYDELDELETREEMLDDTISSWVKSSVGQKFVRAVEQFVLWDVGVDEVSDETLMKNAKIIDDILNSEDMPDTVKKYYETYNVVKNTYFMASTIKETPNYVTNNDIGAITHMKDLFFFTADNANYRLYGKTEGMLEFDARGDNWNDMHVGADWEGTKLAEHFGGNAFKTRELSKFAKENGYNGVIINNVRDEGRFGYLEESENPQTVRVFFNPSDVKSADNITYDDEGKVIPLSKRFNDDKKDIRFSLAVPIEETKDLIAVYNLTEEKLLKTLDEGGFAMPSIAITKNNINHENFGDISVVFGKDTIDPKNNDNKVYSGDAYTARHPQIDITVSDEDEEKLAISLGVSTSYLKGNVIDNSSSIEEMIDKAKQIKDVQEKFVKDNNIEITPTKRIPNTTILENNDTGASVAVYMIENGLSVDDIIDNKDHLDNILDIIKGDQSKEDWLSRRRASRANMFEKRISKAKESKEALDSFKKKFQKDLGKYWY